MSDLESFSFESSNQGGSPESFRLFQERMKAAAAQIQAIKAGEQKQKKKEDELAKILSEFIKSVQNDSEYTDFIVHISKLLALNIPASFIMVLIILNFPNLQERSGLNLISFSQAVNTGAQDNPTLPDLYKVNKTLPPHLKTGIDSWIQQILQIGIDNRHMILERALDFQSRFCPEVEQLMAYSLTFYLEKQGYPISQEFSLNFCRFCLNGMLEQIKKPLPELKSRS